MGRIDHDYATEIRRNLADPRRLCERLGLLEGSERQGGGGMLIRCPEHGDRTASCSVTRGPDGTIRCKCFACDWSGDALTLVAAVHGLDVRTQFPEVLLTAADTGGLSRIVDELRGGKPYEPRALPPPREPEPEPDYPLTEDVDALWAASGPVAEDEDSAWHLEGRGIDPRAASQLGLARALVLGTGLWCQMPKWARYRGDWWPANGYRIIVPTYDHTGTMRGLRAWRVTDGEGPKRLPPAGHRASGLVLANRPAVELLRGEASGPTRVVFSEGEPDFLSLSIRWPWLAVIGVLSGSWTPEFAQRIPFGSELIIRTHHDDAGDRYADLIAKTTKDRAVVKRSAA